MNPLHGEDTEEGGRTVSSEGRNTKEETFRLQVCKKGSLGRVFLSEKKENVGEACLRLKEDKKSIRQRKE